MSLILASASPRRKELLGLFRIPFSIRVADIDETMDPNAAPFDEKIATYPLEKLSYLVLNEVEGAALAATADEDAIPGILREKYPNVNILLTLGKRGCVYHGADGSEIRGKAITVEAVDTTAAGDTHFGFFLRGILDGGSVEEALKLASVASGIAVTRPGAADSVPTYEEVVSSDYYKNF